MQRSIKGAKMVKVLAVAAVALIFSGCGGSSDGKKEQSPPEASSPKTIKVTKNVVKVEDKNSTSKQNSGQFYYSYNKENNKTEQYRSDTNKVRTTIDAYLNIRSPYEKVRITLMIKRLSRDYIIKCSPCHDDYANGVIGPSLLDKNGTFIYGMLQDFKTGKKKNALMKELVSQIDDAKLKAIADEIANFNKEIRKMREGK